MEVEMTEAEAHARMRDLAEQLVKRARRLDALHEATTQTFGKAPDLPPIVDALATTPNAAALFELLDREDAEHR
jgi:hypothetical protein